MRGALSLSKGHRRNLMRSPRSDVSELANRLVMYLERVEIQGFKSFAKKTIFEFPRESNHDIKAKSITSIVGPNGSGKSNVADAIRWVLGEQSLKLIRCKKGDDVIFGGSEKKARQGFAEVSLYMNNEDKELPVDFSEVVITRRVYRTGEGDYLLNKRSVRLFDILILLAKANFGQRSYSIIGQGMVDHIINISAFERKEFFDEATGVKQYQIKRDQSVNRLRRSRNNLDQTNKILAELEPRLRLLTRQIKKLEKRKQIEKDLRDLQKKYYGYLYTKLSKDRQRQQEQFDIKDALKLDLEARLEDIQSNLAGHAREESRKDVFNNLQKDYSKLTAEKNELLKELTMLKGKMSLEYVKFGKQNLAWLEDKKEDLDKRLREVKESVNNLKIKVESKEQTLTEKENKFDEIAKELIVLQNNLQTAQDDLTRAKSGNKLSGYLEAVKAILRQKSYIKGIFGTVSELAKVESMYEAALATAAGNRVSAVVVQNDEVAVKCINYLKENKLSPVTFFPLNKIRGYAPGAAEKKLLVENGAIGFAVDLLSYDHKYKKVFQHVFGSTIVMDNLENAKAIGIGKERMVTLDGDILEKTGVMRGGFRFKGSQIWQVMSSDQGLATQEEKMKQIALLRAKVDDFSKQKETLLPEINELKVELQVSQTKLKGLNYDLEDLNKEKSKIESDIDDNKISPKDQDRYLKNLTSKREELERTIEVQEEKAAALRSRIDKFNLEEEKKKNQVFELQSELQKYQTKLNEVNNEVNGINIELAKLDTKQEDLEKEVNQEMGVEYKLEKVVDEVVNIDELWFNISKMRGSLEQIGGIDPEIVAEHEEVSERFEFLQKQVVDLDKAIKDLEVVVKELDEMITKQFDVSFKKINKAFSKYFEKIFNGGKAKLELVQKEKKEAKQKELPLDEATVLNDSEIPEDLEEELLPEEKAVLMNTGVEIMVAPPNKKISNIAVLSGGERTMTSLALICAIIDSNPAPFVIMDEVDAALDEANSEKFAAILQELSYRSQFVIITHNRVVMHVADVLYGVAMGDDGVSKTLSLKLEEAKKQVNK